MNLNRFYYSFFKYQIQHYDSEKYWKRRALVLDPKAKIPISLKYYYHHYIKKCDAYNNASLATYINEVTQFAESPYLMHGLNCIIIGTEPVIGKNCTIKKREL